ncbi:MAG: DNA mismatch repair protein MutS [Prevotella sp.]|nr:DNA mismatch repair protein MutS [Prevotella sp.]
MTTPDCIQQTTENRLLFYHSNIEQLKQHSRQLKQKNRLFIAGEIITFLAFIGGVVLITVTSHTNLWLCTAITSLLAYIIIRKYDVRNSHKIDRLKHLLMAYQSEVAYLQGDFAAFDNGDELTDHHHAFAIDLDIFGESSLFHRINRCVSKGGRIQLACHLTELPAERNEQKRHIEQQREAIDELAEKAQWRMRFLSEGKAVAGGIDTVRILQALQEAKQVRVPQFAAHFIPFSLACLSVVGFFIVLTLSIFTSLSANIPIWWGILQFFGVFFITAKSLRLISKTVDKLHPQLKAYIRILRLVVEENFHAQRNIEKQENLKSAIASFNILENILDSLDRRGNVLGLMLTDAMFLSDFFLVRKYLLWQRLYMEKIAEWVEDISEMDARVSMATFCYNHPEAQEAEIVDDKENLCYKANGLYHPFLGRQAVKNDFEIRNHHYYIVTGANMAGKSTFLRSVGVNYVLAMCGMCVFADKLKVSCFHLFSSMRTSDDLTHGISYFNAELLRLEQLIRFCKERRNTLIILDEILKGTNSLDKLNGSRLFLETVSRLPVSGIIATHDLELSKMEDRSDGRFVNYCFEIELGANVTYTYKIEKGIARNQNATFLLKKLLQSV